MAIRPHDGRTFLVSPPGTRGDAKTNSGQRSTERADRATDKADKATEKTDWTTDQADEAAARPRATTTTDRVPATTDRVTTQTNKVNTTTKTTVANNIHGGGVTAHRAGQREAIPRYGPIEGGDVLGLVSSLDLDRILEPILGPRYLPAREFFDMRTGRNSATALALKLWRTLSAQKWLFLVLHARQHWLVAIIDRDQSGDMRAIVLDSAPSECVKRVTCKELPRVGVTHIEFRTPWRQRTGSYECGLFVVRAGCIAATKGLEGIRQLPNQPTGFTSLSKWRPQLAQWLNKDGWRMTLAHTEDLMNLADEHDPTTTDKSKDHKSTIRYQHDPYTWIPFPAPPKTSGLQDTKPLATSGTSTLTGAGKGEPLVSAQELDEWLPRMIGRHVFSARTAAGILDGSLVPEVVRQMLAERVYEMGWLLLPVVCDMHWTFAIITSSTTTMYDSLTDGKHRESITRLWTTLGFTAPRWVTWMRQKALQCGLCIALAARLAMTVANGYHPTWTPGTLTIDLDRWYSILRRGKGNPAAVTLPHDVNPVQSAKTTQRTRPKTSGVSDRTSHPIGTSGSGGWRPLPNPEGHNICFANAIGTLLAEAGIGVRNSVLIDLIRRLGLNAQHTDGSRHQEDPLEAWGLVVAHLPDSARDMLRVTVTTKVHALCKCRRSDTEDVTTHYALEVPLNGRADLQQVIDDFACQEELGANACSQNCHDAVWRTQRTLHARNNMLVAYPRTELEAPNASTGRMNEVKHTGRVDVPDSIIIHGETWDKAVVIVHHGMTSLQGHYTSLVTTKGNVTHYNDTTISQMAPVPARELTARDGTLVLLRRRMAPLTESADHINPQNTPNDTRTIETVDESEHNGANYEVTDTNAHLAQPRVTGPNTPEITGTQKDPHTRCKGTTKHGRPCSAVPILGDACAQHTYINSEGTGAPACATPTPEGRSCPHRAADGFLSCAQHIGSHATRTGWTPIPRGPRQQRVSLEQALATPQQGKNSSPAGNLTKEKSETDVAKTSATKTSTTPATKAWLPTPPMPHHRTTGKQREQETHDTGVQPAQPQHRSSLIVSHGAVRRITATMRLGDKLRVRWSGSGESGTWCGELTRLPQQTKPAAVSFAGEWCSRCEAWHATEANTLQWDMPGEGVLYHSVDRIAAIPSLQPCHHDDDESVISEEEATQAHHYVDPERATYLSPPTTNLAAMTLRACTRWFIHQHRPPHVHHIVWAALSEGTRRAHIT